MLFESLSSFVFHVDLERPYLFVLGEGVSFLLIAGIVAEEKKIGNRGNMNIEMDCAVC